ncbi:MAG TPA: hypothetical protein VKY56_11215 [Chloroflexota bacterium]|jgi:hypothetical protein|nr:hypothetical protein [Chloroflexota bacterium]
MLLAMNGDDVAVQLTWRSARGAFTDRVLERVERVERTRRRREGMRFLVPLSLIGLIGAAWAVALPDGASAVRFVIEAFAWLGAVAMIEERLGTALLGPLAPCPLLISLLLLIAAVTWVRVHQPGPPEWKR